MFCKYCGNELADNAVVCMKCGCLAVDIPLEEITKQQPEYVPAPIQQEKQPPKASRKFERLAKIFSIVGTAVGAVCIFLAACFVLMLFICAGGGGEGEALLLVCTMFGWYATLCISPFALAVGILSFVFKIKSTQSAGGLPVLAFVFGIASILLSWGVLFQLAFQN